MLLTKSVSFRTNSCYSRYSQLSSGLSSKWRSSKWTWRRAKMSSMRWWETNSSFKGISRGCFGLVCSTPASLRLHDIGISRMSGKSSLSSTSVIESFKGSSPSPHKRWDSRFRMLSLSSHKCLHSWMLATNPIGDKWRLLTFRFRTMWIRSKRWGMKATPISVPIGFSIGINSSAKNTTRLCQRKPFWKKKSKSLARSWPSNSKSNKEFTFLRASSPTEPLLKRTLSEPLRPLNWSSLC